MRLFRISSERGGALIATLVIGLLFFSVLVWHLSQASLVARLQTHEHATAYALHYAESGMQLAEQTLQNPSVLAATGTVTGSFDMPNGRCAYTLVRSSGAAVDPDSTDPFQPVLVDALATGYYYFDKGQSSDPDNGQTAQEAVLRAKLSFRAIGLFPVASPGRLRINQGTTALFGPIYARDLIFTQDPGSPSPPGVIEEVFFGDTATGDDERVKSGPQPMGGIPHFPALGGKVRTYYKNLAVDDESRLKGGSTLEGRTPPPGDNPFPIYYCEGDLNLGSSTEFEPVGPMIVYVEGNLVIHRSVQGIGNSWAAFLVEKDIRLELSAPASPLRLRGNFIANGALKWNGPNPDRRWFSFNLTGSLLVGRGFDAVTAGIQKKFIRWQLDDAVLSLPRFTQRLESQILAGKYRR